MKERQQAHTKGQAAEENLTKGQSEKSLRIFRIFFFIYFIYFRNKTKKQSDGKAIKSKENDKGCGQ